ncbi:MAG TPA: hypothetical protein VGW39_16260 [Chthoniobacterales bacterium]|nr:hypothetical protein [Chthoniobacterales bacterium]
MGSLGCSGSSYVERLMLYSFGTLMFIAALGAFPLSLFLLRRYKLAVLRSMNNPAKIVASTGSLTTRTRNAVQSNAQLPRLLLRSPQHAALIYAAAGFAYALVTTVGWAISIDAPILSKAVLVSVWSRAWPIVWSTILVAGSSRRSKAIIILTYFSVLLSGTALGFTLTTRGALDFP